MFLERMTVQRAAACLMAAVTLAAATACSGDAETGGTPADFVRADGGRISVAHPKTWRPAPGQGGDYTVAVRDPAGGATLSVQEKLAERGNEDMLPEIVTAGAQFKFAEFARTGTAPVDVQGAEAAARVDYTYKAARTAGAAADQPARGVDVAVMTSDGNVHAVHIVWPDGRLDDETLDGIIGSIRAR